MVTGGQERKMAQDTDLRGAIKVGLDEAFTALDEGFDDLTDEQIRAFPVEGRNNVAWIVMHCLDNLDEYANGRAGGERVYGGERRRDLWQGEPGRRPQSGDEFPPKVEMLE